MVPSLKVPVAVNCCVDPAATEEFAGVMATDTSVPVPMVTVVEPVTPDEVAERVSVPAFLACRMPVLRILASCGFEECQETVGKGEVLPSLYTPVAVNKREVCFSTRAFAGAMVIDTSLTVEIVSVVERETAPEAAVIVVLPVIKLLTVPTLLIVATAGLEVVHRTDWVKS